jgi:hypothetical protein
MLRIVDPSFVVNGACDASFTIVMPPVHTGITKEGEVRSFLLTPLSFRLNVPVMPRRLALFSALLIFVTACERKPGTTSNPPTVQPTPPVKPTPPPAPTPVPTPTPTPTPYVPAKILQTGAIFNGVTYKTKFETIPGSTATADREDDESYTVEVSVKVKIPKPHQDLDELRKLNANLDRVLPGLPAMLEKAKVSPEFDNLYRNKTNSVRSSLNRLDQLLSRHNFYDCETILQLEHTPTKRRALLIQADMDVDTDGSDGDRVFASDGSQSKTYQPFTSYRWAKQTKIPNPCIAIWEKKIAENDSKAKDSKTPAAEVAKLKADSNRLRAEIKELGTFSYLMGGADPFIVLPTPIFGRGKTGYTPTMGDYCVVIVGNVLYPAIIGDAGPSAKTGEASLRLCKQISDKANPAYRAVSELKATYLVFPGTSDRPWGPPNLAKWRERCEELLKDFGGYTGDLYTWEDVTKSSVPPPPPPPVEPVAPVPTAPPTPATPAPEPATPIPATPDSAAKSEKSP